MKFTTPKGTVLEIIDLKGKNYLPVAQRVLWFREERPSWTIKTNLISTTDKASLARAEIFDDCGRLIADGYKQESAQHFVDHMEKAVTGAVGRALSLCGYGTQFATELDEGARIVDAPVVPVSSIVNYTPYSSPVEDLINDATEMDFINSDYVVKFGKYSGKRLDQIPAEDLRSYCRYLVDMAKKEPNKPLNVNTKELFDRTEAYLYQLDEASKPFPTDLMPNESR